MSRITNFFVCNLNEKGHTWCFHLHYPKLEFPLEELSPYLLCSKEEATIPVWNNIKQEKKNQKPIPNHHLTSRTWNFSFLRFNLEPCLISRKEDRRNTGPAAVSVYVWAAASDFIQTPSYCTWKACTEWNRGTSTRGKRSLSWSEGSVVPGVSCQSCQRWRAERKGPAPQRNSESKFSCRTTQPGKKPEEMLGGESRWKNWKSGAE